MSKVKLCESSEAVLRRLESFCRADIVELVRNAMRLEHTAGQLEGSQEATALIRSMGGEGAP